MQTTIPYTNLETFETEDLPFDEFHVQIAKDIQDFLREKYGHLNQVHDVLIPIKHAEGKHKIAFGLSEIRQNIDQVYHKARIEISFVKGTREQIEWEDFK